MDLLAKSREHELKMKPIVDPERPAFHVTGMSGWINDPNGFSVYKGEYHLFYQYHPYDVVWGPMHWGHVTTKDFIKWQHLPLAIAPDMPYDVEGCISGSAIELPDGRQLLFYTGMSKEDYNSLSPEEAKPDTLYQNHCIAIGDGLNYTKYEGNPNVVASTAPEGSSLIDFRDPKIWREGDTYYAIMCSRPADGTGQILLYSSKDALHWEFVSILAYNHEKLGKVWECPDLFVLDGKDVLMVSPQEMEADGLKYHPGYNTIAFIGTYDRNEHRLIDESNQLIDKGIDFYAPQTLESFDGRRIMIAWMSNWDATGFKIPGAHFFGQMTLPRELRIKDGQLYQLPVRELENYRHNEIRYTDISLCGSRRFEPLTLEGISGRYLDMTLDLKPVSEDSYRKFQVRLACDEKHYFLISYDREEGVITIDRSHSGCTMDTLHSRSFEVEDFDGHLNMRIIMDRYSVEVFVNEGRQAASFVLYTPLEADGISFHTMGEAVLNILKYDLS